MEICYLIKLSFFTYSYPNLGVKNKKKTLSSEIPNPSLLVNFINSGRSMSNTKIIVLHLKSGLRLID